MRSACWFAIVPGILVVIALVLLLMVFFVKAMWAWVMPDVFPGAVRDGLIARELSWYTAFKVALFLAVIIGFAHGSPQSQKS